MKASDPLKLAQEITQNFPKLVSSLSRMPVIILPFTMYPGTSIYWNIEMSLVYTTAMLGGCGCSALWEGCNMCFSATLGNCFLCDYLRAFTHVLQINETIKEEIMANQRLLPPGKNLVAINGALLNLETVDLFS